jgi:hypothetical protein
VLLKLKLPQGVQRSGKRQEEDGLPGRLSWDSSGTRLCWRGEKICWRTPRAVQTWPWKPANAGEQQRRMKGRRGQRQAG